MKNYLNFSNNQNVTPHSNYSGFPSNFSIKSNPFGEPSSENPNIADKMGINTHSTSHPGNIFKEKQKKA